MDETDFRRLGHQLIDWIADYRSTLEARPVMSQVAPGEIRRRLPAAPPEAAESLADLPGELEATILPGITHWNHPRFCAYFPSNTDLASVLGDLISSGLGVQGMSWQTSPAATEVEQVMMDWLRQMLGLPPAFTGVIQDTASTATLVALLCARERGGEVVYASDQAHSSVAKAARLCGLELRSIASDEDLALSPAALDAAMAEDAAAGRRPCAVVATTGTTASVALDPIAAVAGLARRHGAWLHVDAAMAGSAMILPECRWMWAGVEEADSLVLNPHKWLGVGFDYSAYFVRDPRQLVSVMSTSPSYLRTAQDGAVANLRDWGLPLGRRFRALKLWLVVRASGVAGLQARLRRDLANAQWLKAEVDAAPDWQRLAPVHLQTVCLRHRAADNLALVERVNRGGRTYLTPAILRGAQAIRVSIGALGTERRHVAEVWEAMREAARA
jgi:aromatic-L-amino-acid/L-tryptophan decarboxylase